jgi:predicted lipoprotein with Yx(FWY)xxD motif
MGTHSRYVKTALAASALLAVAACGSSSANSTTGSGSGAGAHSSGSTTHSQSGGNVEVKTMSGPLGTYLTDSSGRTLYMFASDTPTTSSCTGTCLTYWPPLTTTSSAKAGGGATAAKLGTISSGGSSKQVTYAGHPLYYYAADTKPGDTSGQGSSNFGAKWWMLAPSGTPITGSGGAAGSPSTSSGSGGGGGWG